MNPLTWFGGFDQALYWVPGWLPAPGWYAGIATMLTLGVIAAVFLLKDIRLAVELGVLAFVAGFLFTASEGYRNMGRNDELPALNAANDQIRMDQERAQAFREDVAALQRGLANQAKARRAERELAARQLKEAIDAQDRAVSITPVPAAAASLLNDAIRRENQRAGLTTDPARADGTAQADPATGASAGPAETVRDWQVWGATMITQYGELADLVRALQSYAQGIHDADAKAGRPSP